MIRLFNIFTVLVLTLPALPGPAWAQDISVSAVLGQSVIGLQDQTTLTVKVSGSGKSVPDPALPKTDAVSFYPSGNSSSFQFVNGSMSVSKQLTYTVVPAKTGKFTLGPVTVTLKGQTVSSAPLVITVQDGSVAAKKGNQAQSPPAAGGSGGQQHSIFLKTRLDRSEVYVNQQLTLTYELYSNINLSGVQFTDYPQMTGFWTEDLDVPKDQAQKIINLNGQRYLQVILKKVALFPLSDGTVTIPAAKIRVEVDDFMSDPFAGFFSRNFRRSRPYDVGSDPVRIQVKPLPAAGRPAAFKGAVGSYAITAETDRKQVAAGEPVTVTVRISGTGNIKTVTDPVLPVLGDFETYESGSTVKTAKQNNVITGQKTYKYVFIPKSAGEHRIGSLAFAYFDPGKKAYRTLNTPVITITAAPGAQVEEHVVVSAQSKEQVKILDRDIRYLHTGITGVRDAGDPVFSRTWFWLLQTLPLLLLGGSFFYRRHTDRLSSDVKYARNRRARSTARRRLKTAQKLLDSGRPPDVCCAEIAKALSEYIGHKLNIAATGATTLQITGMLEDKGVNPQLIEQYRSCFEACDFARFAPAAVSRETMAQTADNAAEAIMALEREMPS